jgi:hypothetical protein
MNILKALKALTVLSCFAAASSYASVAELVLDGTSGDFISGGKNVDNIYSSANPLLEWNWATFDNIGTAATPEANYLTFTYLLNPSLVSNDEYATIQFSTQGLGTAIEDETYSNAARAAFAPAGEPGLDISYDHRGCNTLTGNFTVNQLTFANDQIDRFSASFNQSCDGGAVMHGTFNYDADATTFADPLAHVPEPGSIALFGLGILALGVVQWRKQAKSTM